MAHPAPTPEEIDAEIDDLARKLLDLCNLQNPTKSLIALYAATYHLAHQMLHADELVPEVATNEQLIEVCQRQGFRYGMLLDQTRVTEIAEPKKA